MNKKIKNTLTMKQGQSFFQEMKQDMLNIKENAKLAFHAVKEYNQLKRIEKHKDKLYKLKLSSDISEMKQSEIININEVISDTRFIKQSRWAKLKFKMKGKDFCNVVIFNPHNQDIMRVFPFYKANVIDINEQYYMFSPKAFRYVNGIPTLYFWSNMPYAVLMYPNENHYHPSIDTEAFTSVMKSKFIQDAVSGGETMSGLMIAVLVIMILNMIVSVIIIVMMTGMDKKLKALIAGV